MRIPFRTGKEAATATQVREDIRRKAEADTANSMMNAILDMQAEMDRNNVPEDHRELHLTRQQFDTLRQTLDPLQARGQIQSVPQGGLGGSVGSIMGMPVRVGEEPEREPLSQAEMDALASQLTEAVLLLRAGDEAGGMKALAGCDRQCGVRVTTPAMARIRTATEIAARQNSVMYGKSMLAMLDGQREAQENLVRAQMRAFSAGVAEQIDKGVLAQLQGHFDED